MNNITLNDFPIVSSVDANSKIGFRRIYQNGLFVFHNSGFSYCDNPKGIGLSEMSNVLCSNDIPEYFHIYNISSEDYFFYKEVLPRASLYLRERSFSFYGLYYEDCLLPIDSGITYVFSNEHPLASKIPVSLFKKFWSCLEDMASSSVFCAAFINNKFSSICYGAAISKNIIEVDIFTEEEYRGKGLGKVVASQFINECLKRGLVIKWDCFVSNMASLELARSLGFVFDKTYKLLSIKK